MKKIKKYQIVFQNCEGTFPQKWFVYDTYEEAKQKADEWNEGRDTTGFMWSCYSVIEKECLQSE